MISDLAKPKKILVISQYWRPENGVPQRRWWWFSNILINAGFEIVAVVPPPHYDTKVPIRKWVSQVFDPKSGEDQQAPGVQVLRTRFFPGGNSITRKSLNQSSVAVSQLLTLVKMRVKSGWKPDVIVGTVPALPTACVTQCAAKIFNVPYVVDLRDAWPDLLNESGEWNKSLGRPSLRQRILSKGPLQLVKRIVRVLLKAALANADAVIVTSGAHREKLVSDLEKWKPGEVPRVETVRNVFPVEIEAGENKPSRSLKRNDLSINVLYAGTLGRAQDLENALRAGKLAARQGVRVRFRFVGAGAAKRELRDMARDFKIECSFEARKPSESLGEYYRWADTALVHLADWPSLTLSIPSKTYELMDLGIHITGVLRGEAALLIRRLNAGHTVEPGSPEQLANLWVSLARHPDMLEIGDAGRTWVKNQRDTVAPRDLVSLMEAVGRR